MDQRFWKPWPHVGLAPDSGRWQLVEAEAADDDDQPGSHVFDRIKVCAEEPGERLLDGVLRFAVTTQQSIGDVQQEAVVFRPGLRDPGVVLDHLPSPRPKHALCINTRTG